MLNGRYEIKAITAEPETGRVYTAHDHQSGGTVTLKTIHPPANPSEVEAFRRVFENEAQILQSLSHPGLPRVVDSFEDDELLYLVLEPLEGQSLVEQLDGHQGPLPWPQVRQWALALIDTLSHLHNQDPPVIVRNLNPTSVLLTPSGPKIADFGLARVVEDGSRTMTSLRGVAAKNYAPLEQYDFTSTTHTYSDIYSLGATLYFLLTAQEPPTAAARAGQDVPLANLSEVNPTVPAGVGQTIEAMLALGKHRRPDLETIRAAFA
ncbi:MAG: serine/threonine protein kinase [Candidatus Eremiobacteraeota bacterium]|nr:serine/threonine protein kinase [Candidatus Eremiobacteraeota bacterium]